METPHLLPRSLSINVRFQLRHFPLLGQSESHSAALGWLSGAMDLALLFGVATIRAREGGGGLITANTMGVELCPQHDRYTFHCGHSN